MRFASEAEYGKALRALKPTYGALRLSVSSATIVVNSKALFHLFPEFIPPIDRQYTVRFFTQTPAKWRDAKGKNRAVSLPPTANAQFDQFVDICLRIKRLADQLEPEILDDELRQRGVGAPKALDNALVNYVSIVGAQRSDPRSNPALHSPAASGRADA
jgi:hypothetical protein